MLPSSTNALRSINVTKFRKSIINRCWDLIITRNRVKGHCLLYQVIYAMLAMCLGLYTKYVHNY